jgi:hypothetical protein
VRGPIGEIGRPWEALLHWAAIMLRRELTTFGKVARPLLGSLAERSLGAVIRTIIFRAVLDRSEAQHKIFERRNFAISFGVNQEGIRAEMRDGVISRS